MHPFRTAIESGDAEAALALLAPDVVFHSPAAFRPYEGKETVSHLLRTVSQVFENFRYENEIASGADDVLVFRADVAGKQVQGIDMLHTRKDGLIDVFTVMVRPLSGAIALAEQMGARLGAAAKPGQP